MSGVLNLEEIQQKHNTTANNLYNLVSTIETRLIKNQIKVSDVDDILHEIDVSMSLIANSEISIRLNDVYSRQSIL
jgi:hypothetical protein